MLLLRALRLQQVVIRVTRSGVQNSGLRGRKPNATRPASSIIV